MATKAKKKAKKTETESTRPIRKRQQITRGPNGGMQLLLVDDVAHLGRAGDVVEVRPGFGRNYLVPNGLATKVTPHNLRMLERHKERVSQARAARMADLRVLAEQIQRVTVTIEANANEEGHLYGSVGSPEISHALKAMNLNVEAESIRMEGPIREVALYSVNVHLGHDIETDVKVLVVGSTEKKEGVRD